MTLLLKNLLFTVLVPGTVAVYVPLLIAHGDAPASGLWVILAGALLAAGAGTYAWCVWDFATFGRGTPAPIDAPRKLVVRGLYRYTRNPMYAGVLSVILGWAALFRSAGLVLYGLAVATGFHLFVVLYEEPRLKREFDREYEEYAARVRRWLPLAPIGARQQSRPGWRRVLPFVVPVLVVLLSALVAAGLYQARPREYFPPAQGDTTRRLDSYMNAVMASRPAPGMAVGVVKGGVLIFSNGYGLRHLVEGGAVGAETVFHTASVSKTLVALAVMQLVERGLVDLDAPVVRYLPYFRLSDPRSAQCSIRQLLSHTSGLPADVEGGGWWESPEEDPGALERYIRSLENRSLVAGPGERWHYSNMGYEVLGDVIAKVSGMTFEDCMRANILEPLGMADSTFQPYQGPAEHLAWPHRGSLMPTVSAVYPYHRAHAPSSTLKSTVPDLARWLAAHLDRGAGAGARVLHRASMESMWEPQVAIEGRDAHMTLGWFLRRHRGNRILLHAGRDPGFNALVAFLPDHGVGVILLSNYDGQSAFEMVEIADGLLDIGQGRDPGMPRTSILIPLARTLARHGVPAVVEEFRRLRKEDRYSYTTSDLSTLGHELRKQDRLEEAIQLYSLNAAEHPDYFAPYLFLAETHLKMGDERRALDHYRKGLACDPEGRWGFPLSEYRIERLEKLLAEEAQH